MGSISVALMVLGNLHLII